MRFSLDKTFPFRLMLLEKSLLNHLYILLLLLFKFIDELNIIYI